MQSVRVRLLRATPALRPAQGSKSCCGLNPSHPSRVKTSQTIYLKDYSEIISPAFSKKNFILKKP